MQIPKKILFTILIMVLTMTGCRNSSNNRMNIDHAAFGAAPNGETVQLYTLTNANGCRARIMSYGAIVVSLEVQDHVGKLDDVVLGYNELADYIEINPYFGAIVGRYGNRIAKGQFDLSGKSYQLAVNNGENHLHGGLVGFDKVNWNSESVRKEDAVGVRLTYFSPDEEEGYPGNVNIEVVYLLTNRDELVVQYSATTDQPTIFNPTHHSYFNLTGNVKRDILDHRLQILADHFTPVNDGLIPTGEIRPVAGTPMDFRQLKTIGHQIDESDEQLHFGGGYDHNWVLNHQDGSLALAARVLEPMSGRMMEVLTTEPGLQFYSGNFLDGSIKGKGDVAYHHRFGFCLEAQHYPDSPNRPEFPSVVLNPGETYTQKTIYRFFTTNEAQQK